MKVGSIVEFVKTGGFINPWNELAILPELNKPYTVREIKFDGEYILIEEILNVKRNFIEGYCEPSYPIEYFREIQFPPSLEAEIKECLTREFEPVHLP